MGRVAGVTAAVVLAMLMLASVLPLFVPSAAAEGETIPLYVWDGEGSTELASEAANWYQDIGGVITDDIAPTNNSHVLYDATSVKSCTWDLAYPQVVAYSLTLATGYTGTLRQGNVDMGIGSGGYSQSGGTFTGNIARSVYCAGDFAHTAGTLSGSVLRLVMSGDGTTVTFGSPGQVIHSITATGNVSWGYEAFVREVSVSAGKTLTMLAPVNIGLADPGYTPVANSGTIAGASALRVYLYATDYALAFGNITAPVEVRERSSGSASCTASLSSNVSLGGALSVISDHATNTVTLDLAGHSLIANGITIGTRGAIVGDGTIINAGDLDASAGSFSFTGQYFQADDGTITLGAGQSLPNMTVASQGLSTKWSMQMTGAQPYNVTDLLPGKEYAYYEDDVLLRTYIPDENGTVAMTAVGDGTLVSYEIRLNPVITPVPLDSSTHSRHEVDEGVEYRVQYLSDRHVIWSIEGAPFLTIDESGVITGTPGITDSGQYLVVVTGFNGVGWSSVSFILVVNDSLKPVTDEISGMFGLAISLLVVISIVGALMAAIRKLKF